MNNNMRLGIAILALAGFGVLIYNNYKSPDKVAAPAMGGTPAGRAIVQVSVPELTGQAAIGKLAFNAKCATCHGENAVGQVGVAPPLVHQIYRPGHHGDMAFLMAARNGVRSHHWKFGNMPPVDGITDAEVKSIVAYVRALQQANGIN
ncbi:c-type cytochrome [Profundibacter sp.]